jgi:hypothetical protein
MREVITFRNFKEGECATVAERCRVLPPLPSFRVLLGYAVITWSRNRKEGRRELSDVTRNNTQRCFPACQIPALIGETEGSAVEV